MKVTGKIQAAMVVLLSTVAVGASFGQQAPAPEGPKEGLWVERSPETKEPIRSMMASVVTERPSTAKSGITSTARKFLPKKASIPQRSGGGSKELRVMLETARVEVHPGEAFLFVFGGSRNSMWKMGNQVASHPKDFAVAPLEVKGNRRSAALDESGLFKGELISDFSVEDISETEFRVTLPPKTPPGEYAWVYVGGGGLRSGTRIFDFKLTSAPAGASARKP